MMKALPGKSYTLADLALTHSEEYRGLLGPPARYDERESSWDSADDKFSGATQPAARQPLTRSSRPSKKRRVQRIVLPEVQKKKKKK